MAKKRCFTSKNTVFVCGERRKSLHRRVYYQPKGLDIIKPQADARWHVMRYNNGFAEFGVVRAAK